jgi:hypothetical protein
MVLITEPQECAPNSPETPVSVPPHFITTRKICEIVLIGSESHNKSQKEGKWEQKEAKGKKRNEVDVEVTSTWRWLVVHFLIFPHSVGNV